MTAKLIGIPLSEAVPSQDRVILGMRQASIDMATDKALSEYNDLISDGFIVQHVTLMTSKTSIIWVFLMYKPDNIESPANDSFQEWKSSHDDDIPF